MTEKGADIEEEIKILKIMGKPPERFLVTVPKEVVKALKIKGGERVKVLINKKGRRIIYLLLRRSGSIKM